jgi:probable F420-dependent oxidoreductase
MKFGISGCNTGPFAEREHALRLARAAEAAGIESLWTFEHVVVPAGYQSSYPYSTSGRMPGDGAGNITDPLTWITFVAAVTERVRLATGVIILPEHNPVVLAKQTATIDRLSGGRLELGIGVGWLREEFDAIGVPWERRGARTDSYVHTLRALWSDEDEVSYADDFTSFERLRCHPKPVAAGGPPIIIGGHSEAAARRAGRLGDGFYPPAPPDKVAELLTIMRRAADEAGRDADAIEVISGDGRVPPASVVDRYAAVGVSRMVIGLPTYDPAQVDDAFGSIADQVSEFADA